MTEMNPRVAVLFVRSDWRKTNERKLRTLRKLRVSNWRWNILPYAAPAVGDAIGMMGVLETIDVVHFNLDGVTRVTDALVSECMALADELIVRKHAALINFSGDIRFDDLVLIFKERGLEVNRQELSDVILDWWGERPRPHDESAVANTLAL